MFTRPTLTELVDRNVTELKSRLSLTSAVLRRSVVHVLARVIAGASHMLHGHLEFLGRQVFPDRADREFLERHASLFGLQRSPPTYATGTGTATGTNGTVIPSGTRLTRPSGDEYTTTADATIAGGSATLSLIAALAGSDGTLQVGDVLTFQSPVAGANATVTVTASTADGNDQEKDDALRDRLLARMREPAHGGDVDDYVAWAKAVTGVTRVWVTPLGLGPGTVLVRFVRDGDVSPIPDSGEVAAVQAALDAQKPAHATVTVAAPTSSTPSLTLWVKPNTVAMQNAVSAAVRDYIAREGEPGGTLLLSGLRTAIGSTPGIEDYSLTTPSANITHAAGTIPIGANFTFNAPP